MALIIADRVKETSTSTSTGDFTLDGAVNGFQSFSSGVGVGNTCYYVIEDLSAGDWEVGIGTLSGSTILQRTTVLKSSNSNNVVNFGSGSKSVFVTAAADQVADFVRKTNNTAQTISGSADFSLNITDTTDSTQVLISYIDGFQADNILASTSEQSFVYAKYGIASLGANNSGATQATLLSVAKDNIELTYTGSYTQTGNSLLPRGLMDLRYAQFNSTMTGTWNGTVIAGQYGGTGVANTGKTITLGGNLTTSGAYACTFTLTNTTSITLPTTGTVATLAGAETFSSKFITLSAGTTSVAPLVFTDGTNKTTPSAGCMEFSGSVLYFTPTTTRKTVAFTDSTMTGVWNGTAISLTYGGTGATTQAGAANAILPSQTGNSGKYLTTDGANVSWATVSAGLTVTDDTSTNASRYVTFTSATSGSITGFNTSSTRLTFNPSTGDLFVWGNVTANSDRRLKKNIETIRDASSKVRALNGVEFDWIEDDSHSIGLIAQDVEQVAPDLVVTSDLGYKSVNYGNLVGLLVEAIKDLQDEVSALKKQLGDL